MKKILLFLFSVVALAVILVSCEEKEDPFYTGVTIYVSKIHFYPLDNGLSGMVQVSNPSLNSIEVLKVSDNSSIGTVSLNNGEGNYSFTKAQLGIGTTVGQTLSVKFLAQTDGGPAARYRTISVNNPVVITGPANVPPVEATVKISYAIRSDCTAPTSLVITSYINSENPEVVAGDFNLLQDELDVDILPEMEGDTLNYTFTFANEFGSYSYTHRILVVIKRFWDFEEYDDFATEFEPWTLVDNDGAVTYTSGSFDFPGEGAAGSWLIFNPTETAPPASAAWSAYSGNKYAICFAAIPNGDVGNDDWMVSSGFDIEDGYKVKLFAKSVTDDYGLERLIIKVRDNDTSDETALTAGDYVEVPTDWTKYEFDLSDWAGKNVSIMIGCVSYDAYALMVDDFEIVTPAGKSLSSPQKRTSVKEIVKDRVR